MRFSLQAIFCFLALTLSACSAASRQCTSWKLQGAMMSSNYACEQCIDRLGDADLEVIRGCAVGVDAARLLDATSQ